ncbi:hypothetical protein BM477_03960 [Boudabousia marimammalium]|uniref:Phosphoglycolate phosphatase n=1 Tax=Boudabousia marimammalium TaxID=156892 RepID=A0A1Q5PR34_9ACTO|nr:hypothetical protein BM477_03960 [Boudabousia marimammalium]
MPQPPFSAVLIDLDGTITDSKEVIMAALRAVFRKYGVKHDTDEELNTYIGPPLEESFRELAGFTEDEVDERIAEFRAEYNRILYDTPLYDGMAEAIVQLYEAGIPLSLATSKNEKISVRLMDYLELSQYFATLVGSDAAAGRTQKSEVVQTALARLSQQGLDISRPVLVGDRIHDVEGAAANQIASVMVSWGYGDEDERARATYRVDSPQELVAFLTGKTD